ncbi:hypothetical protein J4E90_002183 [Alternaria incomplexa]|uniref:uncharacterized protein n=1 Tax=Alternaria incomplexa TaxID=1187928 RepID=UPI00221ED92B|nr:uncharacterized protein J4E90_002183 [Alternaria incomplexa]KAI4920043.1 hypothetical protein J4E90_002183 [Alternaria incomplexa]
MPPKASQTLASSKDSANASPDETTQGRRPKRKGIYQRQSQVVKRPKADPPPADSPRRDLATSTLLDQTNLGITIDETTKNASHFLDLVNSKGLKLKETAREDLSALPTYGLSDTKGAKYVRDLPHHAPDTRLYEFDEESVNLVDYVQPNGVNARCWVMQAKNVSSADPNERIDLYQVIPTAGVTRINDVQGWIPKTPQALCPSCKQSPDDLNKSCDRQTPCQNCIAAGRGDECKAEQTGQDWHILTLQIEQRIKTCRPWNILTDTVCDNREKIIKLGQITVDVINRYPLDFDFANWYANRGFVGSFVSVTSLLEWKKHDYPQLDLGTIPPGEILWNSKEGFAGCAPFTIPAVRFATGFLQQRRRGYCPPFMIATDGGAPQFSILGNKLDTAAVEAAPYSSGWHLFGAEPVQGAEDKNLTLRNIDLNKEEERIAVKAMQIMFHGMVGMVGTTKALYTSFMHKSMPLGSDSITPTTSNRARYHGKEAGVLGLRRLNKYVCFPMTREAQAGLDLSGLDKDVAHLADSPRFRSLGLLLGPQTETMRQPDKDGLLVTCSGCAGREISDIPKAPKILKANPALEDLQSQITKHLSKVHWSECKLTGSEPSWKPSWTPEDLTVPLLKEHSTKDPSLWTRGYAPSQQISLKTRSGLVPEAQTRVRTGYDPYTMSIEKPHQRCIDLISGEISLHFFGNVTLELHCINLLKSTLPVSSVPLYREALLLREQVDGQAPREGYYQEVQHKWEIIERAHDNQRIVSMLAARRNVHRIRPGQDFAAVPHAMHMEKTGVWDGILPDPGLHHIFRTRGECGPFLRNDDGSLMFDMGDEYWDWKIILQNIDQLEKDPDFNPHGIKFPRLGRKKLPWFWRKDTCPQDLDEEFLFKEFSSRLQTMSQKCDPHHKTEESPATLLLEYAVQFLETGGKDHLFGFIMTPFEGHMAVYSFGRGITQKVKDEADRVIFPGDHLKTGCTVLLPKDMKTDYDITRRTVVAESWLTNRFRYQFHGGPALIKKLEDAVRTIEPTKWYDQMQTNLNDYLKVPLPKSYKDKASWRAKMRALDASRIAEDLENEEVQDDEPAAALNDDELFFTEQLQALEALKAMTPGDLVTVFCSECDESGDDTTLLACSTADHATKMTHYHCLGLDAMPGDTETWPCKQCEGGPNQSLMVKLKFPRYLNMRNIGNTCYLSSSVQGLYAIRPLRDFILDISKEQQKGHDLSGRDTQSWLTATPAGQDASTAMSAHMQKSTKFLRELRTLFLKLGRESLSIQASDVSPLFKALSELDPTNWKLGEQNDSAELFTFALIRIIQVTDNSSIRQRQLDDVAEKKAIRDRGLLCELHDEHFDDRVETLCCTTNYCRKCLQRHTEDFLGKCPACGVVPCTMQQVTSLPGSDIARAQPPELASAALSDYMAHMRRGWDSWMFEAFCIQTVTESKCSDCGLVSRKFTCDLQMLDLEFENPQSDENSLHNMLRQWRRKELDDKIHCASGCRAHAGSKVQHKRITRSSEYMYIRFNRAESFGERVLCGVEVAAYLDILNFADYAKLPSDPSPKEAVFLGGYCIYQLVIVNVFFPGTSGGHYVTYSLTNGIWQKFDDLGQSYAVQEHPQVAINSNGVIHYVVYQQMPKRRTLPLTKDNKHTHGHVLHKGADVPPPVESPPKWQATFADKVLLDAHKTACTLTCNACGETLVDKTSFDTHKSTCSLTCKGCGETFGDKVLFQEHMCTSSCDGCSKTFEFAADLQTHQNVCLQYLRKALAAERANAVERERAAEQRGRVGAHDELLTELINSKMALKKSKEQQLNKIKIMAQALKIESATLKAEIEDLELQIEKTKARRSGL